MKLSHGLALLLLATPQITSAEDLIVQIDGLRNAKGNVIVCLWSNGDAFPDCESGKPVARQSQAATDKTAMVFRNVPAGKVAVSAFHDENANNKFDTNFVRIPLEGVALSNNPKMGFGPPKFKDSTFMPKPGSAVKIKMKYL
jgi:uncharacterized protein (DUF2141 family)